MLNIFNKIAYAEYITRIKNAFPKELESDVDEVLKIVPLDDHFIQRRFHERHHTDTLIHSINYIVHLNEEQLIIPYRLYFNEPDPNKEAKLTERQRAILNCMYLRHHDGYLRQKRLEMLLSYHENWVIPFTTQLLGEYIYQIIEVLYKHVNKVTLNDYKKFTLENSKYWQTTQSRIGSYWDEYYRDKSKQFKDYLGHHIAERINKAKF